MFLFTIMILFLLSFLAFYQFGLIFYRKRGNVKEWIDVKNNFWKLNLKISIHCIFPEIQVIIQDFVIEMVSWIFNWIFLTKSIECLNKLGLSCAKLIFLWVHLPVRLSSCEVVFLWGHRHFRQLRTTLIFFLQFGPNFPNPF